MFRIGIAGLDGSHAADFIRIFNRHRRHPDMQVTAAWGGSADRLAELAELAPGLAFPDRLFELTKAVDGVLVCDRHGDFHLERALAAIAAGRPVFIDKPLAIKPRDAEAILAAAATQDVPVLSGSALRWQDGTARARTALAGRGEPYSLEVYGTWFPKNEYGGSIYYSIHAIELALAITGPNWDGLAPHAAGDPAEPVFTFIQAGNTLSVQLRQPDAEGNTAFGATLVEAGKPVHFPIDLSHEYMAQVSDRVAEMFTTGRSPLRSEVMLASILMANRIESALADLGAPA